MEEGIEFFTVETFHHLSEELLALQAIKEPGRPAMIIFNFKPLLVCREPRR